MQYTDNYRFREPTPAVDIVKVGDINYNSRKIDELIHSTQVSLAPAYDETRTSSNPYMTGDVVMKDALMYRCLDDDVYGYWDATKWERTTAGEEGAGGSSVEANPQGTPTDDLDTIGINGTIYNIAGSGGGGGNVYGAFIDANRVIYDSFVFDETEHAWTATSDCILAGYIDAPSTSRSCYVSINSVDVFIDYESHNGVFIPVKEGQIVTYLAKSGSVMKAYGLTFGTNNIFTPQIYSTEERCVGVWIDNKPLYQKTVELTNQLTVSNNSWTSIGILANTLDIETYVNCNAINTVGVVWNDVDAGTFNGYICLCTGRNGDAITAKYVNLWYTKTTDTAGSGSYNTLGVPMVHYSTDEQVVGTDENGNTIYQRTFNQTTLPALATTGQTRNINLGLTGISRIWVVSNSYCSNRIPFPYIHNTTNIIGYFWDFSGTSPNIQIRTGEGSEDITIEKLTVQYTKFSS